MNRKKELKLQYKQMKKKMGLFTVRSKANKRCYIEAAKDLKSRINMTKFKLDFGSHPVKSLQDDWNRFGKDNFSIEILEEIKQEENISENDYKDELTLLEMIWEERLIMEKIELYKK